VFGSGRTGRTSKRSGIGRKLKPYKMKDKSSKKTVSSMDKKANKRDLSNRRIPTYEEVLEQQKRNNPDAFRKK
jgi:hypothetical protein